MVTVFYHSDTTSGVLEGEEVEGEMDQAGRKSEVLKRG